MRETSEASSFFTHTTPEVVFTPRGRVHRSCSQVVFTVFTVFRGPCTHILPVLPFTQLIECLSFDASQVPIQSVSPKSKQPLSAVQISDRKSVV